jgi:hypothetical protein
LAKSKIKEGCEAVMKYIACKHKWTVGDNAWLRVKSGTKRHCSECGATETMFYAGDNK